MFGLPPAPICTRSHPSASSGLPNPKGPWKCSWMRRRSRLMLSGPPSMPIAMCHTSVTSTLIGMRTRKNDDDIAMFGNMLRLNPQPCIERM